MSTIHPSPLRPPPSPPPQAAPVDRTGPAPPASAGRSAAVAPAADCSTLTGLAQQMCYAARYGVNT